MNVPAAPPRFASVDALRGCTVAAMLLVNDPGDWGHVYAPLEHSSWHGCTPTDLIFPCFLFLVGVSVALAIEPRLESGAARDVLRRAVLWRALRIVALGLALNVLGWWVMGEANLRLPGVLQRIGVCFAGTAWLAIDTRARTQAWIVIIVLLGYAVLLQFGGMEPWSNSASRLDSAVFGSHVYQIDPASGRGHDPEGLLGSVPALVSSLLGLFAGRWLRHGRLTRLLLAGALLGACGALWSIWQPWNKNLWTPSFVLWSSGLAMLALGFFHVAIDRHGWPPLGRRFGVNAIATYAGSGLLVYALIGLGALPSIYQAVFVAPLAGHIDPRAISLSYALAFVALWWLVVYVLDRRHWYLRL